jgi:hypothetical protein
MKYFILSFLFYVSSFFPTFGDVPKDLEKILENAQYVYLGRAEKNKNLSIISVADVYKGDREILKKFKGRKTNLANEGQLFLEIRGKFRVRSFYLNNNETFTFEQKKVSLVEVKKYFKK